MMVSNIMVINDLAGTRSRNDGARCSMRVLDGMCSHMAQTSSSPMNSSLALSSTASTSGDSLESIDSPPLQAPHPICLAVGAIYSMDDFEVLEMLGEGFFSKVLKVRHRDSAREMVLKVSKSTARGNRRLSHSEAAREADIMRTLKHSNVLAFSGICVDRCPNGEWDLHLLVDYCSGGSLSRLIVDRTRHFPWQLRTRFALDIANAMEYIHGQNIMHRDLTSMNVLLREVGLSPNQYSTRAVVADFGLSCAFPNRGERLPQVGTTYYMSPECLKEEFYDEKSDVFSFGVILCQLIARIDADPDSGLHRTSRFGLDYLLFTPCCPPDTPLELLKLAFNSCLLDPVARPSFASLKNSLAKILQSLPSSPLPERDALKEARLGRSRSDAALKRPRTLANAGRKLSNTLNYATHFTPVIEGLADDTTLSAMEELARDVARDEPCIGHLNPFLVHERYRKERKIIPRGGGRRRSETKPETGITIRADNRRYLFRRRCTSLPCAFESPEGSFEIPLDEEELTSPGRIPMEFRDYDMKFVKAMKRFPSRRHTLIPECLAAKSSIELQSMKDSDNSSEMGEMSNVPTTSSIGAMNSCVELSPVVETSFDDTVFPDLPLEPSAVVIHQPQSSSELSLETVSSFDETNNCDKSSCASAWNCPVETVVREKSLSSRICVVPLASRSRRNQKCAIL